MITQVTQQLIKKSEGNDILNFLLCVFTCQFTQQTIIIINLISVMIHMVRLDNLNMIAFVHKA